MSSLTDYLKDTRAELRHVAWPTRTQTVVFTSLVIAVSIFVSVYLGFFDYLFTGVLERAVGASPNTQQVIPPPVASSSNPINITQIPNPTTTVKLK
jgi:preprotein translocase subunit SecE